MQTTDKKLMHVTATRAIAGGGGMSVRPPEYQALRDRKLMPDYKPPEAQLTPPDAPKFMARIDFAKPFALVVDQTESRTTYQVFQVGSPDECIAAATEAAARIALSTGRPAAVFGPQRAVKTAPVAAADMKLEF